MDLLASTGTGGDRVLTVCVVDDHQALRDQLVTVLADAGHLVCAAVGTLESGFDAIDHTHPDVAVIDNQLPDGSGIDLCRRVAASHPQVRLVLHSGVLGADTERDALAAGASAVVAKSVRPDGLLAAIQPA